MAKLALLIPTKNRPESIDYYLKEKAKELLERDIDIVIYDSSTDDKTYDVVSTYCDKGNVVYTRYTDKQDDLYGAYKSRVALTETARKYDYVWVCGDQAIINIEYCYDDIKKVMDSNFDLIHIYTNKLGIESFEATDIVYFFSKFFWSMTHWCAYILSKDLIDRMDKYMLDYYEKGGINLFCYGIFSALAEQKNTVYYINREVYTKSPFRKLSLSVTSKDIMNGWINMLYSVFTSLPEFYNEGKKEALRGCANNIGFISYMGAISMRYTDNINRDLYKKYYTQIKYVSSVPMFWVRFWAGMPMPLAKLSEKVILFFSEARHKIKGKL